jgi:hypothetical protein
MQSNRDSSVLRGLAVAVGNGLAFGAGMTLARRAPASVDLTPVLERLERLENAPAVMDPRVVAAIVCAIDERLQEQLAGMRQEIAARDARITELEGRMNSTDGRLENVIQAIAQACQRMLGRKAERKQPVPISAAS